MELSMNEKILIIDREPDIRKTLESLLRKEGYQSRSASNAKGAIETFQSGPLDLVMMDIRIPGTDGIELMKQLKKLDSDIEIIVLTGAVSVDNAVKALRGKLAFDFLTKPLKNKNELLLTIREALKKSRLNKKRKASEKELKKYYMRLETRIRELDGELRKTAGNRVAGKKILIVDDDLNIQKLLTKMLSLYQYPAEAASDGFEAGLKVMEFKPDLIILDLFMPRMSGFEMCKRIKKNSATSHIKILIITGYDTQENKNRIMEAGADDYLAKPLKKEIFLKKVEKLLKGP
jgi:DNA-binding response OmpR family regulator